MTAGTLGRGFAVGAVLLSNSLIGRFFLVSLFPAVVSLYQRGYGRFSAVFGFILLPVCGLLVSVGWPIWFCWIGKTKRALAIAIGSLPLLWFPYFCLIAMAAAI